MQNRICIANEKASKRSLGRMHILRHTHTRTHRRLIPAERARPSAALHFFCCRIGDSVFPLGEVERPQPRAGTSKSEKKRDEMGNIFSRQFKLNLISDPGALRNIPRDKRNQRGHRGHAEIQRSSARKKRDCKHGKLEYEMARRPERWRGWARIELHYVM